MSAADPTRVGPEHLALTERILALLRALDDPLVGNDTIERHVAGIPVLAARCVRRASRLQALPLGQALARIGNRGLEGVLLELLEDLTVLKAEQPEQRP